MAPGVDGDGGPRPLRLHPDRIDAYVKLRKRGANIRAAAREARISPQSAYKLEERLKHRLSEPKRRTITDEDIAGPVSLDDLPGEAQRALEDFGYFRERYFGRVTLPWHLDAIRRMEHYRETPYKEFAVFNAPPGPGKTTLFAHDYPAWLIVRDRRYRAMMGSRTKPLATQFTRRLRRSFSRQSLAVPTDDLLRRGLAVVPTGILMEDFGRFAPTTRGDELWRDDSFVVAQWGDEVVTDREATVEAFGFETEFVGIRAPLIVWDDLVTMKSSRTQEARETLAEEYEAEAESRLEPGGLLVLQGQRLRAGDLYRHCLDQMVPIWDDDDAPKIDRVELGSPRTGSGMGQHVGTADLDAGSRFDPEAPNPGPLNPWLAPRGQTINLGRDDLRLLSGDDGIRGYRPKYHHIVYPAHFEDRCVNLHGTTDPPADPVNGGPGCLLDPKRLPWRELLGHQAQNPTKFRVLYQQEDVDEASVLVRRIWVDGGVDEETGEEFPGCTDFLRGTGEIPPGTPNSAKSVCTLDPSPTKFWAWQWWLWDPDTETQWLIDAVRKPMAAPDLLDWNHATNRFTGLLEEKWQQSHDLSRPFRWLIPEVNVAQRWLFQYEAARRWTTMRGVTIVPHITTKEKNDDDLGIGALSPHWRFGRVRLPYHPTLGKPVADLLVNEATRYPDGMTDDHVMAHWFLVRRAPKLFPKRPALPTFLRRPSWLRPQEPDHPLFAKVGR